MKIAFLGDIALIGKYDASIHGIDQVSARFKNIIPILKECDYVIGNLETAITKKKKSFEVKTLALKTDPINLEILEKIGINVVSLANNHIFDFGKRGVKEAEQYLKDRNIKYIGLKEQGLLLKDQKDKIYINALCCYSTNAWHYKKDSEHFGLNFVSKENLDIQINIAKKQSAFPILICHWGDESTHYPRYSHIQLAKSILSCNPAVIVGHHPHVIQGIQKFDKGEVAYSLGNFCFDDCESKKYSVYVKQTDENRKGYIYIVEVKNGKAYTRYIPYYDDGKGLIIRNDLANDIAYYSKKLYEIANLEVYEQMRMKEKQYFDANRLGKRNLKWLLHHMNIVSIGTVLQRKINQRNFDNCFTQLYSSLEKKDCILYVGNFEQKNKSAAGKRVYGNKRLLQECGYNVYLIGKNISNSKNIEDIDFSYFPNYRLVQYKKYIKWLKNYIIENQLNPICIIRYGAPCISLFDLELKKYCKKIKVPVIADVVDWLNIDGGSFLFKMTKKLDTWLEKAVFNKKCNGIITVSEYLCNIYRKNANVVIIPPLVEMTSETSCENKCIKIVYAGSPFRKGIEICNVHKIKDRLDLVVESLCKVGENICLELQVYGMTKEEYLVAFPRHTDLLKNVNYIVFNGIKPMQYVQDEISKADFTILLRENNRATKAGFPTKIVESLSLGTPVITTKTSDLEYYIEHGKQGFFVNIENIDNLINEITEICRIDKNQKAKMRTECKLVSDRFLLKNYVAIMREFLREVLTF